MRPPNLAILLVASVLVSSTAIAQAPDSLSFQGVLTNAEGIVVSDGDYNLLIKLYKGSSKIWEQNHVGVPVKSGIFHLVLSGTPTYPLDTVAFNAPIDLGVAVNGGTEMVPRTPLTSAAYARGMPGMYTVYSEKSSGQTRGYNVVGGGENNIVGDVIGATIGGGGGWLNNGSGLNQVLADWGTVAGGIGNTVEGLGSSTVGGGNLNTAGGSYATVAGGFQNAAEGITASTVGGGYQNTAGGSYATVPGGLSNSANAFGSFAAGQDAVSDHDNTFVWNDGSPSFTSTGADQFLIDAAGGVGIGTNQPAIGAVLHVEHASVASSVGSQAWGFVLSNSNASNNRMGMRISDDGFFDVTNKANEDAQNFARLNSTGAWTTVSDRRLKTDIETASHLLGAALELEPVRYRFKNQMEPGEKTLGLIGQQVQQVEPSLVTDGSVVTVNYAGLSVVAIGAIQELYDLVQEQRAEIEQLRAVIERAGLE